MKKFLCVILLLTLGFGIYSQPNIKTTKADQLRTIQNPGLPVNKSGLTVLYDSLLTYSFTSESDSELYGKFIYTYDGKNQIESLGYTWDKVNSSWKKNGKNEYAYDNSGRQTMNASYSWNPLNSSWAGNSKIETGYDPAGNLIYYAYYPYWNNNNNTWVGTIKTESEFGGFGELIKRTNYEWNSSLADWGYVDKEEHQYDKNDKQILMIDYMWNNDGSNWLQDLKEEDSYNEYDSLITKTQYTWDSGNSNWVFYNKDQYSYDTSTVIILKYRWIQVDSTWNLEYKSEETHKSNGKIILSAFYQYDKSTQTWIGQNRKEYSYDDKGNLTSVIMSTWIDNLWLEFQKTVTQYDTENRITQQINSSWNGTTWDVSDREEITYNIYGEIAAHRYYNYTYSFGSNIENIFNDQGIMVSFNQYDGEYDNWVLSGKGFYYWTTVIESGINDVNSKGQLSIFPNPVTTSFRAEGFEGKATLYIYDLRGQMVFTKDIIQDQQIDINSLPEGLYFVKLNSSKGYLQTKLIRHLE